ncbi:MAG: zinc metallopeptidase [Clostridiaceae bacterium]|nr:zinc metallopeptidase [Clostridiaceae bacterium]
MFYGIDSYYIILVLPAIIFAMIAQGRVTSAFNRYSKERTRKGITGADAARAVLQANGVSDVRIEMVAGNLTDHYDPRTNVIRLSENVYNADTVAAVGVAAHEAGHAVQYAYGYVPIKIRSAIIPVSQIGSTLAMPMIFIGIILNAFSLIKIGIVFFAAAVVFQLITLPVEFNASNRAIDAIASTGILYEDELPGAQKTLSAAALTYVAALLVSLAQFIRLLLIFGGGRRNRD